MTNEDVKLLAAIEQQVGQIGITLAAVNEKLDSLKEDTAGHSTKIALLEHKVASLSARWTWIAGVGSAVVAGLVIHTVVQYL